VPAADVGPPDGTWPHAGAGLAARAFADPSSAREARLRLPFLPGKPQAREDKAAMG
jgi:hypothetical protein